MSTDLARVACAAAVAAAVLLLGGCSTIDRVNSTLYPVPQVTPAEMVAANSALADAYKPAPNGAIFQAVQYRPLLEDHRARLVGDIVTITITEKLSATQTATSSIDKSGTVSGSVSAIPFLPATALAKLAAGGTSANTSSGKGATVNTNDFTGTITATVVGVLPNGHLLIRGEKQIGVNQNVDTLQFTGQVDPLTILPGNTVASTQVANVRIQQSGRGAQADAQAMGWMSRFFLNLLPI